jgi:hypothetical protein
MRIDKDKTMQILDFFQEMFGGDSEKAAAHVAVVLESLCEEPGQAKKLLDAVYAKKPIFDPQIFDPQIADDFCDLIKMGEGIIKRRKYND